MKNFTGKVLTTLSIVVCTFLNSFAQSPGQIVRRSSASTVLDPNTNGYVSSQTTGFTTSDITQSEIPYKTVPLAFSEPIGDLATDGKGTYFIKIFADGENHFHKIIIK